MKFGFGGKIKPRKFDFVPRYYDEIKDNIETRLGKPDEELGSKERLKERIKFGMRQKYYADKSLRTKEVRKSNIRLLYVFIVLIFVCYMILKSDKITQLFQYLDA
jgi:hypothetical protein